jgi:tetratricopeptide (TPR) repeat protein
MCDEAAARAPHGADVHIVRGLLLEGEGSWDEADDQYERAINAVGREAEIAVVSRTLEKLSAPISGSVYLRLARMLQERHPERAHRAVEQALKVGRSRATRLQIKNGDEHVERTGLKLLGEILESISRRVDAAATYYQSGLRSVRSDPKSAADLFARASSLDLSIAGVHWFWAEALRVRID